MARVVADDDAPLGAPPAPWPAGGAPGPAVARRTVTRFMRIGPAAISPRSPAVPNWSRPAKRSAERAPSPARCGGDQLGQLGAGVRVGIDGQPRHRGVEQA